MLYLRGYYGTVPPMTLIAPFARVARSTNRSTHSMVITGRQLQNVTAARPISVCPRRWHKIRWVHRERDQARELPRIAEAQIRGPHRRSQADGPAAAGANAEAAPVIPDPDPRNARGPGLARWRGARYRA